MNRTDRQTDRHMGRRDQTFVSDNASYCSGTVLPLGVCWQFFYFYVRQNAPTNVLGIKKISWGDTELRRTCPYPNLSQHA